MSSRNKSSISVSYQPADLTTTTNTIFEEGDSTDSADRPLDSGTDCIDDDDKYRQAELITKLRQRIDDLETEAERNVPLSDHQRVQQEWQTSEDLLRGSQRDNEQKHETIEQYKAYVKELERIIDETLGPNWKVDHQIRPPLSQSTCFSASTPLPKPSMAALRRSVSIMPSAKRSSKIATRHLSASTFGSLNTQGPLAFDYKEVLEMDDTPTGAMRKLMGSSARTQCEAKITERVLSGIKPSSMNARTISPSKSTAPAPTAPVDHLTMVAPTAATPHLNVEQIDILLRMLAATHDAGGAKEPSDAVLLQTMERIEKAEKAADAREGRLQALLEEARVGCP